MATGFIAAGAGIRPGVVLERIRLVDVAPTAARLLGVPAPPVEGRVLVEILDDATRAGGVAGAGHVATGAGGREPGSPRVQ
jgi:hypothetical protein